MAIQGPNDTEIHTEESNNDTNSNESSPAFLEAKVPDYRAPARFKDAPLEWKPASLLSRYNPFSSTKPDPETYQEAEKQWELYSEKFLTEVNEQRYQADEELSALLEAQLSLKDLPEGPKFVRDPHTTRKLNDDVPLAEGFNAEKKKSLANKLKQLDHLRKFNTEGTKSADAKSKKEYSHLEMTPGQWFANRIEFAEAELSKSQRNPAQVMQDCGFTSEEAERSLRSKKPSYRTDTGTVSQFNKQAAPILNAFKRTIMQNLEVERNAAEEAFKSQQQEQLSKAAVVRKTTI